MDKKSASGSTPPMICTADVDTRLLCNAICVTCPHYMRDRRRQERRAAPRPTHDRRVLGRHA